MGAAADAGAGRREMSQPDGFVAKCPFCGTTTGAMDYTRTSKKDAAAILGKWLMAGKTIEPKWGSWCATVENCQCAAPEAKPDAP